MKKWTKDEEEELLSLLKDGLSYKDISELLDRTPRAIKEKTNKLGYKFNSFLSNVDKICLECGNTFSVSGRDKREMKRKFCSQSCSATYNNKNRSVDVYQKISDKLTKNKQNRKRKIKCYCLSCGKEIERYGKKNKYCNNTCHQDHIYKQYIIRWKNGEEDGMRGEYSVSEHIRKYLHKKYDNKCSKCGWNKANPYTGKIPLEVEHIDGNHKNNKEENLNLICPNCHSLTETYKGANKGKGRKLRRKYDL